MPTKLQKITDMYENYTRHVTDNYTSWTEFLRFASRNWLPFDEQFLVFAQRPDATAVLEMDKWNRQFGRWVNRGAKGIGVIDRNSTSPKVKYYFDISDTNGGEYAKPVPIWEMKDEFVVDVIETLEARCGELAGKENLQEALISAANNLVDDNITDYLADLRNCLQYSPLAELGDDAVEQSYTNALKASVKYMLLARCGIEPMSVLIHEDFDDIKSFNTHATVNSLGIATSHIAQMGLREIAATVRAMQKESRDELFLDPHAPVVDVENDKDGGLTPAALPHRTIANSSEVSYTDEKIERNNENGTDIHERERVSDTQPQHGRSGGSSWTLRPQAPQVFDDSTSDSVHEPTDIRQAERSSDGDRPDGEGANRLVDVADGASRGDNRGAESSGADEVGGSDEQHSSPSRGDGDDGVVIRLDLPSPEEQQEIIAEIAAAEGLVPSAFSMPIPQKEVDDELCRGSGTYQGKYRIYDFFRESHSIDEAEKFLKSECGVHYGHSPIGGSAFSVAHNAKGITFTKGSGINPEIKYTLPWKQVATRIKELIAADRYFNSKDKEELYPKYLDELEESKINRQKQDFIESVKDMTPAEKRESLPTRLADFVNLLPQYLKEKLRQHNFAKIADATNAAKIEKLLTDPLTTERLADAMRAVYGASSGVFERNGGYRFSDELKELHPREMTYYVGDKVYIGNDEYEILSLDSDVVKLHDVKFPIMSKDVPRDEFERRVSENPLNDHLMRVVVDLPEQSAIEEIKSELLDRGYIVSDELVAHGIASFEDFSPFWDVSNIVAVIIDDVILIEAPELYAPIVGDKYELDDKLFVVESIDEDDYEAKLREVSLDGKKRKRNFRIEDIEFLEEQKVIREVTAPIEAKFEIPLPGQPYETYEDADEIQCIVTTVRRNTEYNSAQLAEPILSDEKKYDTPLVGDRYEIGHRKFIVESVNDEWETAKLRDITFENESGFPIFRVESFEFLSNYSPIVEQTAQAEKESETLAPNQSIQVIDGVEFVYSNVISNEKPNTEPTIVPTWEQAKKPARVNYLDAFPNVPMSERSNFQITDDDLGVGGAKAKFRANMDAIHLLKDLEFDRRLATPQEQEILSRYVGWGSLQQAFDPTNSAWADEHLELHVTLSPEEYESARATTLNAHYTTPLVIKSIYKAIENMGFVGGNILDPGCGIGNFQGLLPDSMGDSKVYGIEIDPITGRIAQQLYQKNSIAIQGYENTSLPDSFFDLAIGNIPFGGFGVNDKRYNKHNFRIHDYFFAKTLDKVRPGGVIAFVTSKGTMDKANSSVRNYLAQRADLLGAIRLPNNAFKANAGTEVTSDIIFLQKHERMVYDEPSWVHLGKNEDGIPINQYFIDNPDMILGTMARDDMMYGSANETTCRPHPDRELSDLLDEAIQNIHGKISPYERHEDEQEMENGIPADPNVRNFSFTVSDGQIYYRENSMMYPREMSMTAQSRVRGMIEIRDCVRNLIEYQTEDYADYDIQTERAKLNKLYDSFTAKYGLLNSQGNKLAFDDDSSYPLLCSLEILDDEKKLVAKAAMFTQRTIRPHIPITHVDTASEALAVSLAERARVDLAFMSELTGMDESVIAAELSGVIFKEPQSEEYQTADEYLSGNVREKLEVAKQYAEAARATGDKNIGADESLTSWHENIDALEQVIPKDLTASEISVRLGASWLPIDIAEQFMYELLGTPVYYREKIKISYSKYTSEWNVAYKTSDSNNIKVNSTYGTKRANAYRIIEDMLNLRDVRLFDYIEDANGNKKPVLNKKDTMIAQSKQEQIKAAFDEWIWKDPDRRERLCRLYNDKFNSIRPREYDGSHINFVGMNPEISLRQHQKNAVARVVLGGNSLLGHVVGAGKTYTMVAAAMEMKRIGLANKSMIVVPNHIIEQFAAEWLQLYPSANILVSTKKDFEKKNRKKFCGRIATGDYDAVIIGHSQFEKIPLSAEFQHIELERQMDDLMTAINYAHGQSGNNFTIKQLEKSRKMLQLKMDKLNDQSRKDDILTFEELGVDRLFVDEAHSYKNLFLHTKMRNVGGITQTDAQKSSDMYMKCRYLDKETGGKGVIFATGTPISNSMVEMYTMQRYLQYGALAKHGLRHFDEWASTFGETVTAIELAPEGSGYRAKTRFAKFYNLPELMKMFREVADIQTADMLDLPVPKANFHNVVIKPSEFQKEMVQNLAERAKRVRNGLVESHEDNMLLITNDGRKLALDQRLMNPMLPDNPNSKANIAADNVHRHWVDGANKRLTQLVFCDLSTPKKDGSFNVYEDIQQKLIERGIPEDEIAFIHNAESEAKKKELFSQVRNGKIRVLIGSTYKMGSGTNVQDRLIALHHLDVPWRPSDLEQREGRIIRQKNNNPEVEIYRYVTEGTFDAYSYQVIENKQKFIAQVMTSKSPVRVADDIDEQALSYAEVKALATGNPLIVEKYDLEMQVGKLKLLKSSHLSQQHDLEDKVLKYYPSEIKRLTERIAKIEVDIAAAIPLPAEKDDFVGMKIDDVLHTDKKAAGTAILVECKAKTEPESELIGEYRGFGMYLSFDARERAFCITLKGQIGYKVELGDDIYGNITRLDNAIDKFAERLETSKTALEDAKNQLEVAKAEIGAPFPQEAELAEKSTRLSEVNIELNIDKHENEFVDAVPDEGEVIEQPAMTSRYAGAR